MIYSSMFAGGADTAYLKITTKINKTALYALYNYTWQDNPQYNYDGQELDLVVKQPLMDNLSVAFKFGVGYRDAKNGGNNTTATDTRLFLTCVFWLFSFTKHARCRDKTAPIFNSGWFMVPGFGGNRVFE